MADRCATNATSSAQSRLPSISGRKGTEQILHGHLRLPRIEGKCLVEAKILPALKERTGNRKFSHPCLNRKEIRKLSGDSRRNTVAHVQGPEVPQNDEGQLNRASKIVYSLREDMTDTAPVVQSVFRRPVHFLRRRIKPAEMVYRNTSGHEELLVFDHNTDQLSAFMESEETVGMSDLSGTKFDANRAGNGDITSYMALFEVRQKSRNVQKSKNASTRNMPENKAPSKMERESRVKTCFFEALDLHFYHYYRNTHPGRRMAICEEIERTICVDSMTLSSVRDHLRFQESLDGWML